MKFWLQCFFGVPMFLAALFGAGWLLFAALKFLWAVSPWLAGVVGWALMSGLIVNMPEHHEHYSRKRCE